jgi:hypothetical protein
LRASASNGRSCASDPELAAPFRAVYHPVLFNDRKGTGPNRELGTVSRPKNGVSSAARGVGLRKVAEIAGVSTATVSRAMNNPELVSPELQERIASVVQRLGWVPHGAPERWPRAAPGRSARCFRR